jgi:hypothetical protein
MEGDGWGGCGLALLTQKSDVKSQKSKVKNSKFKIQKSKVRSQIPIVIGTKPVP